MNVPYHRLAALLVHHRKLLHYNFSFPVMVILFGFDMFKPVLVDLFQETPKTKHHRVSILVSLVLDSYCIAICFFINRFNKVFVDHFQETVNIAVFQ